MLNQVVLVGRLTEDPNLAQTEKGNPVLNVNLAVSRPFKNSDGIYETDFIRCTLWNGIAENTSEYCKKGDVIGVKGRLQTHNYVDKEGNKRNTSEVIAERITFLSSKKDEQVEETDE